MVSTATPRSAQAAVSIGAGARPYFCTNFSFGRRGELFAADGERLDRHAARIGERRAQFLLRLDHPHAGREQAGDRRAHARAIVVEIGLVREEIRERRVALGRRVRIEHDLQHAQEPIVFDDKEGRVGHGAAQG